MRRTSIRRRAKPPTHYGTRYEGAATPQEVEVAKHAEQDGYFECPVCGNWASLRSTGGLRQHRTIGVAKVTCPYRGYPKGIESPPAPSETLIAESERLVAQEAREAYARSQRGREAAARRAAAVERMRTWRPPLRPSTSLAAPVANEHAQPLERDGDSVDEDDAWAVALLWTELGGDEQQDRHRVATAIQEATGLSQRQVWRALALAGWLDFM